MSKLCFDSMFVLLRFIISLFHRFPADLSLSLSLSSVFKKFDISLDDSRLKFKRNRGQLFISATLSFINKIKQMHQGINVSKKRKQKKSATKTNRFRDTSRCNFAKNSISKFLFERMTFYMMLST